MRAYIFPGQGAQFTGMGRDLHESSAKARELFAEADEIMGFAISETMFTGTDEELRQTRVTQPAIFLHSVIAARLAKDFAPDMVAGHSLGEFSALVANGTLTFADGLRLVAQRAEAMQKACEAAPSTMAAVLGLDDEAVERECLACGHVVVPANYNCPGQLVISGSMAGVEEACERMKAAGAKRAIMLQVGGAFHSPLMEPAKLELQMAIEVTDFRQGSCPIYQNYTGKPATHADIIKKNLISQLTAPVRWTQSVQQMVADGATEFIECGPGKVLQGLVKKINRESDVRSV